MSLWREKENFMHSPEQNPEVQGMSQLTDTVEFLKMLPVFTGAPGGVTQMFAYLAKREEYVKGQMILSEGKKCDRFFLIMAGQVDIFLMHNERRFHLQLLSVDSLNYFGELALLSEFNWFFSARAWTDVQLLSISREAFVKVLERFPESYQTMVQKIINLRIQRFSAQTRYQLDNLSPEAWREDPPESG